MVKRIFKTIINTTGYEISKIHYSSDIKVYSDIFSSESISNKKFYNIGAGDFFHQVWTNVDNYESGRYQIDRKKSLNRINYDLLDLKQLPIETRSAEIVYSCHKVEHITDEAAKNMFNESFRILKKGGVLRVVAPNIDLFFRAYINNDRYFFCWLDWSSKPKIIKKKNIIGPMNKASIGELFLFHFAASVSPLHADGVTERINDEELEQIFSEMEYESALNYCSDKCPIEIQIKNPKNHINWWNKDKMFRMLKNAGFEKVYLSGYGQSFSPVLRNLNFFDNHPKISLYVEAIK